MITIPMDVKEKLREIGLDKTEQQVYVALLTKGLLNIQDLTNTVGLPRSSVHLAVEGLIVTGVVKVSITGKRRYFYVEHPRHLENFLLHQERIIEQKKLSLETLLPRFMALFTKHQNSDPIDTEFFSGEDGFVEVFYRSLDQPNGGEVLRFGSDPAHFTVARDRLKQYRMDRVKKNIMLRMLLPDSEAAEAELLEARYKFREVRILDQALYNPDVFVTLWQSHTALTVWDNGLHSIIIRNSAVTAFMKQMFEIAWAGARVK